jgi:hypothetical protein
MKNSETPMFPCPYTNQDGTIQHDVYFGLTKREYLAGKAVAAMIANPNIKRPSDKETLEKDLKAFSAIAIEYADALLSALEE